MGFPNMKSTPEFNAYVRELLQGVPDVTIKGMFGGQGIFREGLMFACLISDELYLRASEERAEQAREDGRRQFSVEMRGRTMHMPYWTAPEAAMDDADLLTELAEEAFADALAADARKPKSKRKHKPAP